MTQGFCPHEIERDDLFYLKTCDKCKSRMCSICKIILKHDDYEGEFHAKNCPRYIEIRTYHVREKVLGFSALSIFLVGFVILLHKQISEVIQYLMKGFVIDEQTWSMIIGFPIIITGLILGVMYFDPMMRTDRISNWCWNHKSKTRVLIKNPISPYLITERSSD